MSNYPKNRKSSPRKYFVGQKFIANNGSPCTLIRREGEHFYFQYDGTDIVISTNNSNLLRDGIRDIIRNKDGTKNALIFSSKYAEYVGTRYKMNDGFIVKVVDYKNPCAIIEFEGYEQYGTIKVYMQDVLRGGVRSPFKINANGGFLGIGFKKGEDTYKHKAFKMWRKLLRRTNQEFISQGREISKISQCYIGAKVCPDWYCYYNFFCWYNQFTSTIVLDESINFQLDKDLLYPYYKNIYGCKFYSPETCVIIPEEINKALVIPQLHKNNQNLTDIQKMEYKIQKENHIKQLAKKYRSINAINNQVYQLLMNFNVDLYMEN